MILISEGTKPGAYVLLLDWRVFVSVIFPLSLLLWQSDVISAALPPHYVDYSNWLWLFTLVSIASMSVGG